MSANALQARSTSGRHQRCCCRQCWSKIRCRRCAARKLALRGRPAQERNVEHRAWQDDPASLCARRRLVGCPKNRQEKLIGSRRTARQRHESSSGVVHGVRQKTPVISRSVGAAALTAYGYACILLFSFTSEGLRRSGFSGLSARTAPKAHVRQH